MLNRQQSPTRRSPDLSSTSRSYRLHTCGMNERRLCSRQCSAGVLDRKVNAEPQRFAQRPTLARRSLTTEYRNTRKENGIRVSFRLVLWLFAIYERSGLLQYRDSILWAFFADFCASALKPGAMPDLAPEQLGL